jgi:type III secretion protein T
MGDLIDIQTGSSNAEFFDPVADHEGGRTGEFLGWLVVALFVSTGGLLALVGVLIESFQLWPVATFIPKFGDVLELFAIRQGDTLLLWTVKLAAPVVMVLMLAELGIGLIGRVAPQLDVFVFAQPVKSLLAVLMLILLMFYLFESMQAFLNLDNSVLRFLRAAL